MTPIFRHVYQDLHDHRHGLEIVTRLRTAIAFVPVLTENPQQQVVRKGILADLMQHCDGFLVYMQ